MRQIKIFLIFGLTFFIAGSAFIFCAEPTVLTVLPFTARDGNSDAWLKVGLADLLTRDLSEIDSYAVVERQRMQEFIKEMELQKLGIFDETTALRLGRVAHVDQVVFGNYERRGNHIEIVVFMLDMRTQQIIEQEKIDGNLEQLRSLTRSLVLKFVKHQGISLTQAEHKKFNTPIVDSISATQHFYEGLNHYDFGRYAEAFGSFSASYQKDSHTLEAYLWMAHMWSALSNNDQALLAFKKLYSEWPHSAEARDALLLAGQILEQDPRQHAEAINAYQKLRDLAAITPHGLRASYQLGILYEKLGEKRKAYDAFQFVYEFFLKRDQSPASFTTSSRSLFIGWRQTNDLRSDTLVHLIGLLPDLVGHDVLSKDLKLPQGVFVLNPSSPTYFEPEFGRTPSLLKNAYTYPKWREEYYVMVVPREWDVTGVDISLTGQLLEAQPYYSYTMGVMTFPFPRDFIRDRLGTIHGQTSTLSTLKKTIPFYGRNQNIVTFQLLEAAANIQSWGVKAHVKKKNKDLPGVIEKKSLPGFWEGKIVEEWQLPEKNKAAGTRPYAEIYYKPRKEISLLREPNGSLNIVVADGALDGDQTDLYFSESNNGLNHSELKKMSVNSLSHDTNPKLVRAEDGTIWLFWISNRRGWGWEIWCSSKLKNNTWSHPRRLLLDKYLTTDVSSSHEKKEESLLTSLLNRVQALTKKDTPKDLPQDKTLELLEYDVMQDAKGVWHVVMQESSTQKLFFFESGDTEQWLLGKQEDSQEKMFGFSLTQDQTWMYHMSALTQSQSVSFWSSNDFRNWTKKIISVKAWTSRSFKTPGSHRTQLLPDNGKLLLLVSDNIFGLQFARFDPQTPEVKFDLVSRCELQPYAAVKGPRDEWWVAFKNSDDVMVRQYKKFSLGEDVEKDNPDWPIYIDSEKDVQGNLWNRIFARERYRLPDVTSLGVEPEGRVWWGIESGIMFKQGDQCFATDVSQGFFYHDVTQIAGCGRGQTFFLSKYLPDPLLGVVLNPEKSFDMSARPQFSALRVPGVQGRLTSMACGNSNTFLVGTASGHLVWFDRGKPSAPRSIAPGSEITAVAYDPATQSTWVGTDKQGLFQLQGEKKKNFSNKNGFPSNHITALAVDAQGILWAALKDNGLGRYQNGRWTYFTANQYPFVYKNISVLAADPTSGVWFLPDNETPSRGIGFADLTPEFLANPRDGFIKKPNSIAVDQKGHVWIGTESDGVYEFIPRKLLSGGK